MLVEIFLLELGFGLREKELQIFIQCVYIWLGRTLRNKGILEVD